MKIKLLLPLLALTTTLAQAATIIPFEREVSRIDIFAFLRGSNESSLYYRDLQVGDAEEKLFYQGFSLQNMGPNTIVTTSPDNDVYAYRNFSFVNTDKSRRDNLLWITDYNGSGSFSDLYETALVFLPRENQLHVEENGDALIVTLNTGEEVLFSKTAHMITGGVLKEKAVDFNPNQESRRFPRVTYSGKGIVIRSDARAADPRLAKTVQVLRKNKKPCIVPGSTFWTQGGFPKFKFVDDDSAMRVIEEKCGKKFLQ